jgi:alpha-D-ribose 1-methylphosphonate 5-triphosphate synthase subunit PhnG
MSPTDFAATPPAADRTVLADLPAPGGDGPDGPDLPDGADVALRRRWLGVLARAGRGAIERCAAGLPAVAADVDPDVVRPAEIGTVMVEGRAGGTGRRFNLGEATVTRCVVRVGGRLGFAYGLGRDRDKAVLAARLDALLQDPVLRPGLMAAVIEPLERAETAARDLAARKAAATKVAFFTLVRGDG